MIVDTLESLRAYMAARVERYEIVVVDDGSLDKIVALVEGWCGETT
ncbi:MAG: glycosyltransferase [Anaerolineales bacterium]